MRKHKFLHAKRTLFWKEKKKKKKKKKKKEVNFSWLQQATYFMFNIYR